MNPQKSLNTSFKAMDPDSVNKSQLNHSVSKMQYSFPKKERFSETKKYGIFLFRASSSSMFYELPSTRSMRSTTFGYGDKVDMGKRNFICPSPDRYKINNSDFQKNSKNGITMGQGRSEVKANDMFHQPLKHSPEPCSYNPKPLQKTIKYSLHPKLQDLTTKWIKSVPGPGSYSHLDLTSKAKPPIAKHESVKAGKFDQLPRLSEVEMRRNKTPAPNSYKNPAQLLYTYKYQKKGGNSFAKSVRKGILQKSISPGPGKYSIFSEFA